MDMPVMQFPFYFFEMYPLPPYPSRRVSGFERIGSAQADFH